MASSRQQNDVDTPSKFWCAVPDCTADGRKKANLQKYPWMEGVQFFPFPTARKENSKRKQWLKLINRENFEPRRHHRVCSLHFVDSKPSELHPVPTLFPRNNYKQPLKEKSQNAILKREKRETDTRQMSESDTCEVSETNTADVLPPSLAIFDSQLNKEIFRHVYSDIEVDTTTSNENMYEDEPITETSQHCEIERPNASVKGMQMDHSYTYVEKTPPQYVSAGTQTEMTGIHIDNLEKENKTMETKLQDKKGVMLEGFMENVLKSDASVKRYTGVPSKKLLDGLFDTLDKHESSLKYWSGKRSARKMKYLEEGGKPGPKRKLSRYQEFILTLLRLRLGIVTFILADMFGVSNSRVSQIFTTWITFMSVVFGRFVKWQSKEMNIKTMPLSFKRKFPRTRSIIDCTEFFVQRPRKPSAQSTTYSSYKHHNTFKALVSITPSGAFNFVSDLWGGNVSDRYITEHSGYLDNIEPNDEVMADRGFTIRDLLTDKHATLNIPPFTHKCSWGKRKRLNANEIKKTRTIANLRIHVERAIQRLKCFRLLSNVIPLKLKFVCNQMMRVASFLCNLDKPLVKK